MVPFIKRCNQLLGCSFSLVEEKKTSTGQGEMRLKKIDLTVEDICVGLQFTSDHSIVNMESHNSQDKLVSLESGLSHPLRPSVERSRKSHGCTKRILIYVATVLLIVVGYEIWQSVRSDHLIQKLEDERQTLPSELDNTRLDDMAEELSRVRIELKEMKERMDQRAETTTPKIIELPETTTIVESISGETSEDLDPEIREWLVSFAEKTPNDDVEDSNSNTVIPRTTEAPEVTIADEQIIEDPIATSHIDEPESGWGWKVYFSFGRRDEGGKNSSEETDVIETDVGEPTQVDDEKSQSFLHRFTNMLRTSLRFGWGNSSEDESESGDEERTKSDIVDADATTTPNPIIVDYLADLYDEDYNLYEDYASYEYPSSSKLGDYGNVKSEEHEDSTTGVALEFAPSEFDLTSTSVEDEPEITKEFLDSLELFADSKQTMDKPSIDELDKRLVEILQAYHQDEMDEIVPSTTTSDEVGWSYISKRSIDSASSERPIKSLSPEEMSRKLDIINQAVDVENHILQNELIVASEPMKNILRRKIDNFYRKMEAVSAHIDRLHQKYLKMNKLEDDYVSREFPSDEDNSTLNLVDRR